VLVPSLVGAVDGNDAVFLPLVFLHVISALAGFGSVGFAGTYASRAAHLQGALETSSPSAEEPGPGAEPGPVPAAGPVPGPAAGPVAEPGPLSAAEGSDLPVPQGEVPAVGDGEAPGNASGGDEELSGPQARAELGAPAALQQDPEIEELTRYFGRPARFWKAILFVPVFGLLALWAQPRTKGLDQIWTLGALLVWVVATLVVVGLVVPALNQMRAILLAEPAAPLSAAAEVSRRARLAQAGAMASRGAVFCDLLFLVALALMIWQP